MNFRSLSLKLPIFHIFVLVLLAPDVSAQNNEFIHMISKEPGNPKISFRGNVFELMSSPSDTVYIENPVSGEREMKISRMDLYPAKMNDFPIANSDEVQVQALPERSMDEYFIDLALKHKELFNKLPDGQYRINPRQFVVSEEGKIMYYKFDGLETIRQTTGTDGDVMIEKTKAEITLMIHEFISAENIHFKAAEINKKKVLSLTSGANVSVTVKGHKMTVDL